MPKAKLISSDDDNVQQVWIYCPGCKSHHAFTIKYLIEQKFAPWTWNGDTEKPTFSPSMLCNASFPETRCHSFVRDGKIQFLADCWHELKNQTVDLPEI